MSQYDGRLAPFRNFFAELAAARKLTTFAVSKIRSRLYRFSTAVSEPRPQGAVAEQVTEFLKGRT